MLDHVKMLPLWTFIKSQNSYPKLKSLKQLFQFAEQASLETHDNN